MAKTTILHLFRTHRVIEMADLIAVKIEGTDTYWIYKCRYSNCECTAFNTIDQFDTISEGLFFKILNYCIRPIVLSSHYVDIDKNNY